jgi:outer membrane protein assembly factor BamE
MTSVAFFMSKRIARTMSAWAVLLLVAGCAGSPAGSGASADGGLGQSISTLGGWLTPYRADVLQGNVITQEQVALLREGLSRDQVAGILGTPLLKSVFHANRWDYVFTRVSQGAPDQQRRLTVWFEADKLVKFDTEAMPTERDFVQSISRPLDTTDTKPLEATPEQIEAFKAEQAKVAAQNPVPAPTNASAPTTNVYPALNETEGK